MNKTASIMKNEIRLTACYRALIISRYYITILLSIISIYLGLIRYTVSSLYIILFLNVLPYILIFAIKDYAKKSSSNILTSLTEDPEFKLKYLKSKYKYSRLSYFSNSISYMIALILIFLWQLNYSSTMKNHPLLVTIPITILVSGIAVRFLGIIIYRLKIPYDLKHNKL